ncbi:MAG: cysteine desulfurase [Clostridia bacterium]|nr:cysteine desulfurase [Clostridia bacterium]
MREIYLDNSATTRISEGALKRYNEVSREVYGNPSSLHSAGHAAERLLTDARSAVRESIRAEGAEVIFTASGSEANNLAIIGRALSKERYRKNKKIITTLGEHASVREPLMHLSSLGFTVVEIPTVGGALDLERLRAELDGSVILVTLMMVNNETGAVYDLPAAARLVRAYAPEALIHVDATQGYMKIPFTKGGIGADMITLSSHKIEGPKGVGALVVDKSVIKSKGLSPLIFGGGQEGGLRSGTENVPAIAAFAEAVREGSASMAERVKHIGALRDRLLTALRTSGALSEISPTLPAAHAPHIINLTLPGIKSETALHFLSSEGIFVSSGSACSSNSRAVSSALVAFGRSEGEADCSIRVSLSHRNTTEDIDALAAALERALVRLARVK